MLQILKLAKLCEVLKLEGKVDLILLIQYTLIDILFSRILQSKSAKFPVNKHVVVNYGWRTHSVIHEDYKSPQGWGHPTVIKFNNELPLSYALGILGMPGYSLF